jgi:hypothetical protein
MAEGVQEEIHQKNTKRRKAVSVSLDNLLATGLTREVAEATGVDRKWQQARAQLQARVAQEEAVLRQDLLAFQQHASSQKEVQRKKKQQETTHLRKKAAKRIKKIYNIIK